MNINFNKVSLYNFLSFHQAEVSLSNKGFCSIKGVNRCPKDNALSNGSGKSTLINSICWCLTGETLSGISKNLKNQYVDEKESYVTLFFTVDADSYEITRYISPKTDLKIIRNGENISGKGIRESELVLASYLPDLNAELIGSVILIGQGMPNKFSNRKPAERKELLEKLSKSDFMIEDIKNRIATRRDFLDTQKRDLENQNLKQESSLTIYKTNLEEALQKLNTLSNTDVKDFDVSIEKLNQEINAEELKKQEVASSIKEQEEKIDIYNRALVEKSEEKSKAFSTISEAYNKATGSLKVEKISLETQINSLKKELRAFAENPGVCPTCGQKLPNAEHILEEKQAKEFQIQNLEESLNKIKETLLEEDVKNSKAVDQTKALFDSTTSEVNKNLTEAKKALTEYRDVLNQKIQLIENAKALLRSLEREKTNYAKDLAECNQNVTKYKNLVEGLEASLKLNLEQQEKLQARLDVVKQLETLAKRDFRGYLLEGIISYIDSRCKEYSLEVFGTTELDFKLNDNNIDVTYCSKPLDNLSGGEQQRINIIIQFAIRDMMCKYLNFNSNILFLDEVFDNLDLNSCNAILNLISNQLSDVESIFIISHHDELDIPADSEILIEKGADGISKVV